MFLASSICVPKFQSCMFNDKYEYTASLAQSSQASLAIAQITGPNPHYCIVFLSTCKARDQNADSP